MNDSLNSPHIVILKHFTCKNKSKKSKDSQTDVSSLQNNRQPILIHFTNM